MNKPAIIEAILADARRIGGNMAPRTADVAGTMYGSVKDKLAGGPKGLYEDFRTKVVDDATASANALRNRQIALGAGDNYQSIKSKDKDALATIAELVDPKMSTTDLLNLNAAGRSKAAIEAATAGIADNSFRGIRRRGAEWVAANPDTAIPVGVGAATLGTTALLTASGQALAQLTNNMNQSLATEANRENVLTS